MSEKKEKPGTGDDKGNLHCAKECIIGLEECTECGACTDCSEGSTLNEDDLPPHWQQFIKKSRKST
jgi:hypothetical protein